MQKAIDAVKEGKTVFLTPSKMYRKAKSTLQRRV